MKKYIYIPEDRKIWLDLAKKLHENSIAIPVISFGDDKYFKDYKETFQDCEFLDYGITNIGLFTENNSYKTSGIEDIVYSPDFLKFKEQAIKMMDRVDLFWWFRNIDRNDLFYSILFHLFDLIKTKKPDFILMSWTPHVTASFIMYGLCKFLSIPGYSFVWSSILPCVYLLNGIDGKFIDKPKSLVFSHWITEKFNQDIQKFINKFQGQDFELPTDIRRQYDFDKVSLVNFAKKLSKNISLIFYKKVEYFGFSSYKNSIWIFEKIIFFFMKSKIIQANIDSLKKYESNDFSILEKKYVYFPLHYEPERTTNPDGWNYYDQIKALLALRKMLPIDIPIYVKEHYSQFTQLGQWYRWKGRFFYVAISKIENLHIINMSTPSVKLIKNALFTVSITWTTILESICFEVPTVIMWNAWFENFTWVTRFTPKLSVDEVISNKGSRETCGEDIKKLVINHWIFGTIGSLDETFYPRYYNEENIKNRELADWYNFIVSIIK